MLLKAHPKVGERVVKTTHVTDWIENKLQQEVIVSVIFMQVRSEYETRLDSSTLFLTRVCNCDNMVVCFANALRGESYH